MKTMYDKDIDLLEVFFKKEKNYSEELSETISVFKSEEDDSLVGYSFENAKSEVFSSSLLSTKQKLAILLKIYRTENDLTQAEMAHKLGDISIREYQRLESGKDNTTLDSLDLKVKAHLPELDLSLILKGA